MSIETLTSLILDQMPDINKWQKKFMLNLFPLLLALRGRHNFENLSRYGQHNEVTYRMWYGRPFDFLSFNKAVINTLPNEERIIALDPSYLPKSGKCTPGIGYFWSGCAQATLRGMELTGVASVGLESGTAMHLHAEQTIGQDEYDTLLGYYCGIVRHLAKDLKEVSSIVVADAYFSKEPFVQAVTTEGMTLISKLASNSVLIYPYIGPKTGKRGRPKQYDGNVDRFNLRKDHFTSFPVAEGVTAYEGKVYVRSFKRLVKCVILHTKKKNGKIKAEAFFSTDVDMDGAKLLKMYRLRFQIEFLYRDAKQFTGLTQCQARDIQGIHTHLNVSLTAVSLAKAVYYLSLPKEERGAFSMSSIKSQYFNELFMRRIFSRFGNVPEPDINSPQYEDLRKFGCIAA